MLTRERLKQIEQRQSSLWFSADHRELIATVSELLDLVEEVERLHMLSLQAEIVQNRRSTWIITRAKTG